MSAAAMTLMLWLGVQITKDEVPPNSVYATSQNIKPSYLGTADLNPLPQHTNTDLQTNTNNTIPISQTPQVAGKTRIAALRTKLLDAAALGHTSLQNYLLSLGDSGDMDMTAALLANLMEAGLLTVPDAVIDQIPASGKSKFWAERIRVTYLVDVDKSIATMENSWALLGQYDRNKLINELSKLNSGDAGQAKLLNFLATQPSNDKLTTTTINVMREWAVLNPDGAASWLANFPADDPFVVQLWETAGNSAYQSSYVADPALLAKIPVAALDSFHFGMAVGAASKGDFVNARASSRMIKSQEVISRFEHVLNQEMHKRSF